MDTKEREKLFTDYLKDCVTVNPKYKLQTLMGYRSALNNLYKTESFHVVDKTDIYKCENELDLEQLYQRIQSIDKGGDPSQGVIWYRRFLSEMRFKSLLEWFVKQIRINNGIIAGDRKSGNGYKGEKIREEYIAWRKYNDFELDCSLRCDYAKAMSGANYIHLTDSRINIVPVFIDEDGKSDVTALKIVIKADSKIVREHSLNTVQQLGLYDKNYPNKYLREFFDNYKREINGTMNNFAVENTDSKGEQDKMGNAQNEHSLNLILYGPAGTGKTYKTISKAVEIVDPKAYSSIDSEDISDKEKYKKIKAKFDEYKSKGQIAFTTFHQSYGYEEFIEGIKPDLSSEEIKYKKEDGVFKAFCKTARVIKQDKLNGQELIKPNATVWKISLDSAGRKGFELHNKCLDDSCIRIGWDEDNDISLVTEDGKDSARRFVDDMEIGDIVLSCYSQSEIDAIGVITGDYEWHDEESRFKRFRKVEWLKTWRDKEKCNIKAINHGKNLVQTTVYKLQISLDDIIKLINEKGQGKESDKIKYDYDTRYVFIIDEINRGNVSKIFGELITLIEPTKRLGAEEEMTCKLPYSGDDFGVPKNVYIIGTMNTADRSLVQLDTALRRRFEFEEMMPDYDLLKDIQVGDVEIGKLLEEMNKRITVNLDREHQIGHSYFMELKNDESKRTKKVLDDIFNKKIIPLLKEYFFDDYNTIRDKILSADFVDKKHGYISDKIYNFKAPDNTDAYKNIYINSQQQGE